MYQCTIPAWETRGRSQDVKDESEFVRLLKELLLQGTGANQTNVGRLRSVIGHIFVAYSTILSGILKYVNRDSISFRCLRLSKAMSDIKITFSLNP